MRLWSLHPRYLDRPGLTAAWRESLLAQAVLAGRTRGYTRHPQLERFRACEDPLVAIGAFLSGVQQEASERGYRFDVTRIDRPPDPGMPTAGWAGSVPVATGQVGYEWEHLMAKLARRSPEVGARWATTTNAQVHPLFVVVPGPVASWERPGPS
ncbi:pyrimidine dimer DNA glycosylase/endonuclease V [Ornithinimicrobium faecis]|uniref:Pyrimidine dimer DNA glycosylase/endonuclease V n=1 Tax=Ornithinimicrobium faecis TaxID=2934158 RepID=A0ABY4YQS0_9MICO|nr:MULTISPECIES: pyrimidine dimer DNA glycosylase/endonuclease V [unclassified Ornithinimicrobium]USQ78855.1 pyrimidine dimer DNA glycosylase/endonuclease V [Ornithinimicrobium sp. HY1793]